MFRGLRFVKRAQRKRDQKELENKESEGSGIDCDDDQDRDSHVDDYGLHETMCHLEEFKEFVLQLMRQ